MSHTDNGSLDRRLHALQEEYADEDADAAAVEAAEHAAALEVPLSLRITRELDAQLRQRAAAEHIPTSALVRRLLSQAVHRPGTLDSDQASEVEQIARRVAREELPNQ